MAPYVSVVLPVYSVTATEFAKLLVPIDALAVVDSKKWYWVPWLNNGVCEDANVKNVNAPLTLLECANLGPPRPPRPDGVWDFRQNIKTVKTSSIESRMENVSLKCI
jgi:hypothetical protein